MQPRHKQRHRRHPEPSPVSKNWSPSMELARMREETTTIAPEDWVFLTENATLVRAHIGSTAVLECKIKKDSQFGMVS